MMHFIGSRSRRWFHNQLSRLNIPLNSDGPAAVHVLNDAFYDQAVPRGVEGILDAYVEGWWDCPRLDELTAKVLAYDPDLPASGRLSLFVGKLAARLFNRQSRARSKQVRKHYDLGNDLFEAMLDRRMVYSCAYWKDAANLDEAQEAKLALIAKKVGLRPGMRVLDIGCGWGSFAKYAAETYGVSVVGVTLSENQHELGCNLCRGLPVDLRLQDYRDLNEAPFDAVVSIGMFEHVGHKNYRRFMQVVRRCLAPEGLFLLQTIGESSSTVAIHPWINRNVFPNAVLPSPRWITTAAEEVLVLEDWHGFGHDYDKTLMAWFANFDANWPRLRDRYGDRFYRLWKCYLLICAGSFRARVNQLWQIVFSPSGHAGGYVSCR